ncbi:GNAT family N-acetyltransferase [Halobacillus sp. A5]|uniref:GNAT family N-acetyltransferase n=1 Tax=Halobacillus sp. A5 TaxID=2880263 RepID=UPI0020A67739|nr:GNAT family protein [Halobacillus sp. A5]MCP3026417.1 GNAT family N-acetyltransferase [Halobacillus sp. A5]
MIKLIERMTQNQAEHIAYHWHYDGPYSFYNMEADPDDLADFLNPEVRGDHYFAALDQDGVLVGFFSLDPFEDGKVDIGVGLKPELTGQGLGMEFLTKVIYHAQSLFKPRVLTLSVADFNQRAIKLYRKAGFEPVATFLQKTNGSHFKFIKMERQTAYDSDF